MLSNLTLEERKSYKQCNTCFEVKLLTEFWKNKDGERGTYGKCKECGKKEYDKDRDFKNQKRRIQYQDKKIDIKLKRVMNYRNGLK
jgi:hypothetical protein